MCIQNVKRKDCVECTTYWVKHVINSVYKLYIIIINPHFSSCYKWYKLSTFTSNTFWRLILKWLRKAPLSIEQLNITYIKRLKSVRKADTSQLIMMKWHFLQKMITNIQNSNIFFFKIMTKFLVNTFVYIEYQNNQPSQYLQILKHVSVQPLIEVHRSDVHQTGKLLP